MRPPAADTEQSKAVLVFLNTKGNGEKKGREIRWWQQASREIRLDNAFSSPVTAF